MADAVHCDSHGECDVTFTCSHLADGSAGIGFNRDEPTEEEPFPDAVCDGCDLILEVHGGWTDESEKLIEIRLLCSRCYELCHIRNTRTDVTFEIYPVFAGSAVLARNGIMDHVLISATTHPFIGTQNTMKQMRSGSSIQEKKDSRIRFLTKIFASWMVSIILFAE